MQNVNSRYRYRILILYNVFPNIDIDKKIDISDATGKLKRTSDIELFLLLFGDGLVQMLGDEIDRIEEIVRDHIPEAKHVDIEVL